MALPAAGGQQGSDTPIPPSRWSGAGGPHTGGAKGWRGLSGTEDQADGSTTKRFMRLNQGPDCPDSAGAGVTSGEGRNSSQLPGQEARKDGVARRQEEPRGAKEATGASTARPPGRPASCSGRVRVPAWLGAAGWTPGRPGPGQSTSPPPQTADHHCSRPAHRTWLPPFLCSRGGGRP